MTDDDAKQKRPYVRLGKKDQVYYAGLRDSSKQKAVGPPVVTNRKKNLKAATEIVTNANRKKDKERGEA